MKTQNIKYRITSIDALRGLVMLIMLVDHVRERVFLHAQVLDPMDISTTNTGLFFTRLSAHICAPVFIFLTGLSAWLYENPNNKPKRSARAFLFKRGLFIIVLEITIINFSWFGYYETLYLQVMWAIGLSMLFLAAIIKLPNIYIALIGGVIIFGHNALSGIEFNSNDWFYNIWTILHDRGMLNTNNFANIKVSYPVLPWLGLICIGYFSGSIYNQNIKPNQRFKILRIVSISCLGLLVILRGFNFYGETLAWKTQDTITKTIMSFLNYTKYPPSLDFLLFTMAIGTYLLVIFEKYESKTTDILKTFGGSPMFFYVLHLYVLLALYNILLVIFGKNKGNYFGVDNLWLVWLIAVILSFLMYLPVKKFGEYKRKSKSKWIKYF
ncbi:DUF1624 domain-containing protein [Mangrovimonas cancribranchiae]|uniref:Heparan-alpha-glucosaminide N-acetyltransferase domain-containing protein n=1 Tax=Mangrovimonas cancribranchiae TaxID=3080055 RepID=A0AAU6PAW1_9FLAO